MISVRNLTKKFGSKTAVDDLSFSVEKGEVLGFLGPNGAGKSTTMRMVTGYFVPSAGEITVDGIDMLEEPIKAKRRLGYLPENAPLYSDMTVLGFLKFVADMRKLHGKKRREGITNALETCMLEPVRHQSIDTLSKGYRHRTCLAQSILHDPEVLILDEPTDGLDPNQKHEVRSLIKRMGEKKTIVFSTHILEEVEAACTRALIINQGKIVADGTPDELRAKAEGAGALHLRLGGMAGSGIKAELEKVAEAGTVTELKSEESCFVGTVLPKSKEKADDLAAAVAKLAGSKGWEVFNLHQAEGRLDDVFRGITKTEG